jgi:alkanesulfonate monooxygenase SsuD/methylene tetrahydromethanopterin reductase-like flavin-dependent oxidoreductase (luciferase family)
MRVGVSPFASTRSGVLALAARAVEGGIGMLWLGDGLLVNPDFPLWSGGLEPFTELAWLAGRFEGVTVGVSAAILTTRDVVWTAKQAMTLDHLTGGRSELAVAPGFWAAELEHRGVDFATRGARFREAVDAIGRVFAGEPFTGSTIEIPEGRVAPGPTAPGRPPLWLAGGDATARHALLLGLPFQASRVSPAAFAPSARRWFDEGGRALGVRVRISVAAEPPVGVGVEWHALTGPPAFLTEQLAAFADLGVSDVSLIPGQDDDSSRRTLDALVEDVLPHLA